MRYTTNLLKSAFSEIDLIGSVLNTKKPLILLIEAQSAMMGYTPLAVSTLAVTAWGARQEEVSIEMVSRVMGEAGGNGFVKINFLVKAEHTSDPPGVGQVIPSVPSTNILSGVDSTTIPSLLNVLVKLEEL
jgi:hypothetical protein